MAVTDVLRASKANAATQEKIRLQRINPLAGTVVKDNRGIQVSTTIEKNAKGQEIAVQRRVDTGETYKPDLAGDRGMGFSLKKTLKKVGSVATSVAGGFVGGGNVGAVAGLVKGTVQNTKTSQARSVTLKGFGADVAVGAVTNIAAGAAAKGAALLAGGGKVAGVAGSGAKTSLLTKLSAFGKTGGVTGNIGKILSGTGKLLGAANLGQLLKGGGSAVEASAADVVPGTNETLNESIADQGGLIGKVRGWGKNLKPEIGDLRGRASQLKDLAGDIRENGVGNGTMEKLQQIFLPGPAAGGETGFVNVPTEGGGQNNLMLAALGIGALFLFTRIKK